MSERIERWVDTEHGSRDIDTAEWADGLYDKGDVLAHPERSWKRIYIIDADEEDARKCENCRHWSPLITKGNCLRLNNLIAGVNPCSPLGIECWGIETPPDFYCKYFERK